MSEPRLPYPGGHRSDGPPDAHAVPQQAPAVPDGGIPVVLPAPRPTGSGPRRSKRGSKLRRKFGTPRARWIAAAALGVGAVIAGLLASGFVSSPAPPLPDATQPAAGAGLDSVAATPPASASGPSGATSADSTSQPGPGDIQQALQQQVGDVDNPLNHLRPEGSHRVSVRVTSSRAVQVVGYLVPTSINTNYVSGTVKPNRRVWALDTTATGSGNLAAVFVQGDSTGTPVRCKIIIDGKTTNSRTTAGPYGRQVCLG